MPAAGRSARYRCVAALATPDGEVVYAEAVCEGTLRINPAGSGGFGYDPIFVPAGWETTMAELTDEQKDRISHRGRAFRALLEILEGAPDLDATTWATELKVARRHADVPADGDERWAGR